MLTDKIIKSLTPQPKDYQVADRDGLYVRIRASGAKVFFVERRVGGRRIKTTLGRWPEMTLSAARQELAELTPQGENLSEFGPLARQFFAFKSQSLRPNSLRLYKHALNHYLLPQLEHCKIAELKPRDLLALLPQDRPAATSAVLIVFRSIAAYAQNLGVCDTMPCAYISRLIAKRTITPRRSLPADQLYLLADGLKQSQHKQFQLMTVWGLASMLRAIEFSSVQWSQIDGDVLTLPATIMKTHREHRVPIVGFMADVLQAEKRLLRAIRCESEYVWPKEGGSYIDPQRLYKHLTKLGAIKYTTLHGFRSTARSWLAEQGYDFSAAELCLAHVDPSSVVRAYQRSDLLDKRRELMYAWGEFLRPLFDYVLKF